VADEFLLSRLDRIDLEAVNRSVCGTDAAVERIRIYLQRVLITVSRSIETSSQINGMGSCLPKSIAAPIIGAAYYIDMAKQQ
jgi:hypothetical protein